MNDDVLNSFVDNLLTENIEDEKFKQYIDIFSRFLGFINPEYHYNGTYLSQYVDDFIQVYQVLRRKNKKYIAIYTKLISIGLYFDLIIDRVFCASFNSTSEVEYHYIGIDKNKIASKSIEIRISFESDNKEYIFCKEYDDFEEGTLLETVYKDVKKFKSIKKLRRINNETK